jgi:CDP-4-dehydro-6-deoxyglucose reductase/ferredoxin-NAD(P)+ reductase (naphthalene dioxygenase ferredoxin-specific)
MPKVFIPQAGRSLDVNDGQTILLAALAAGIPYPHGCKSGRCGSCKSRLVSGEVDLLPHTPFALSPTEQAGGLILACRAQPLIDATVAWLGDADEIADIPVGLFEGAIAAVEDATHDIKLIRVRLDDRGAFTFRAGQYARLFYPGAPSRDYSVASRPDEELIEFHVRRVPEGAASQRIWASAAVGDRIAIEGPLGSAFLRERHSGPILGIAGGSGLAPVKAVAETALAKGMGQPIRIYFGARSERDLYLLDRFAALTEMHANLSFVPVLSEESGRGFRPGYVSEVVAADLGDLDGWKAYLAGPPAMVDAAGPMLLERGLRAADIHADVFYTPEYG